MVCSPFYVLCFSMGINHMTYAQLLICDLYICVLKSVCELLLDVQPYPFIFYEKLIDR